MGHLGYIMGLYFTPNERIQQNSVFGPGAYFKTHPLNSVYSCFPLGTDDARLVDGYQVSLVSFYCQIDKTWSHLERGHLYRIVLIKIFLCLYMVRDFLD